MKKMSKLKNFSEDSEISGAIEEEKCVWLD